jgi:hypothetical protein
MAAAQFSRFLLVGLPLPYCGSGFAIEVARTLRDLANATLRLGVFGSEHANLGTARRLAIFPVVK